MAFPAVAAINGSVEQYNPTEHTVDLPANISAGDLLIVIFCCYLTASITFPEGWTELFQGAGGILVRFGACYRVADGEEGATITVTTATNVCSAHNSYRITGYSSTPEVGTMATAASTTPDPPSLSPTWGAKDTLWLAVQGNYVGWEITAYPTNYTDGRNDRTFGVYKVGIASARRELNAESDDPATFTQGTSSQWAANTIAIKPIVGVLHELVVTEGIALTDTVIKTPMKVIADGVALTDTLIRNPIKILSDGIALTDVWEGYKLIAKVLSDGIALADTLVKSTARVLSDGIAFTDVVYRVFTKVLSDGVAIGDALRKDIARVLTDGIAFTDIVHRLYEKVFTDGIKIGEILLKWRWLAPVRRLLPFRLLQPKREEPAP